MIPGEDSEPAIPYGIDLQSNEERDITTADSDHRYSCPVCGDILDQRREGKIRSPYFAHHPKVDPRDCPLYTGEGMRQFLERSRNDAESQALRIRLFIQVNKSSGSLTLFGSIPPLSAKNLSALTTGTVRIKGELHTEGAARVVSLTRDLLPGRPVAIPLNPDSKSYLFDVRPLDLANGGTWKSAGLRVGDSFVGTSALAEKVGDPRFISTDQYLYLITDSKNHHALRDFETFTLGQHEVTRIQVTKERETILRNLVPKLKVDSFPLAVNVVLPFEEAPRQDWGNSVVFYEGEEFLLSIVPPPKLDPRFHTAILPFFGDNRVQAEIHEVGVGKARFLRVRVHEAKPFRLLIHWPLFVERDVLFDFIPGEESTRPVPRVAEVECEVVVQNADQTHVLSPFENPTLGIPGGRDSKGLPSLPHVSLRCPKELRGFLEAEYPSEGGLVVSRSEGEATSQSLNARLQSIFDAGARSVKFSLATLGSVTLTCNYFIDEFFETERKKAERKRIEEELAKAAAMAKMLKESRALMAVRVDSVLSQRTGSIPRHVSVAFIQSIGLVPTEVSSSDMRFLRNMVRRWRKAHPNDRIEVGDDGGEDETGTEPD